MLCARALIHMHLWVSQNKSVVHLKVFPSYQIHCTAQGLASIVKTRGNQDVHVILRGGTAGPNYTAEHVGAAIVAIEKARPQNHPSVMIDCSRMSLTFSC
jgi:phospho-2-dehydro-3-deoxyheptonate aldolase